MERIGPHGGAEVWRARNSGGLQVTLRVGRIRGRAPEAVHERLEADLAVAARAQHPNVVRVLGAGVEDGMYYVVSEPVDGVLLRTVLDLARSRGPWPKPHLAGYVAHQLTKAIAHVHQLPGPHGAPLGALNRELNPGGIVVERSGMVKLAELVSSLESQDLVETATRKESGVVAYVSPESVTRTHHDGRSDIFALGAIFWELLTGRAPFSRPTDLETLEAVRTADLPPMSPGVPSELARIAQRCVQKRPEDRFESIDQVATALQVVLQDQPDAGPRAMAQLLAELEAGDEPQRPRTAMLSMGSQAPRSEPEPDRTVAETPSEAERADVAETADPFFDPVRDAGGLQHPRFEVIGRLGSGAMGQVYKVRDKELDEVVALKRIPPETAGTHQHLERLRREVRLARRIASEHVCRIFDIVDLGEGERGLTMAVVEGDTLSDLMARPMPTDYRRIARWGADIADGLAAAHGLNVVHRDLKPENVMIRHADDRAVVLDFGIARPQDDTDDNPKLTQAGIIMGTPLYMSPEQLVNGPLDGRSDLYSLGLMLAELVTGEVPLGGRNYTEILDRRVRQTAEYRLSDVAPGAPAALAQIIDGLLTPAAAARLSTATAVKASLQAFAEGEALDAGHARGGVGAVAAPTDSSPPEPVTQSVPTAPAVAMGTAPDVGVMEAPPAPSPASRYLVIAALLMVIALVLIYLLEDQKAATVPPAEVTPKVVDAGQPAATEPAAPSAPDAGVIEVPDSGAEQPKPVRRRRRNPATLPPAEEM